MAHARRDPPAMLDWPLREQAYTIARSHGDSSMFARHLKYWVPLPAIVLLCACVTQKPQFADAGQPHPPLAATHPYDVQSPNGIRVDNYYWLRDDTRRRPDVLAYLNAENAYYTAMTAHTKAFEDTLYAEMIARLKPDDSSVPAKYRHFYYYTRFLPDREYPIHARRSIRAHAAEQILLDDNAMAEGHDFFQIGATAVSPNERMLAYAVDTSGRRQYTIAFKDLKTGETLPDTIIGTPASMAWADDNKTLLYVENDPITLLTVRVRRHVLGSNPAKDAIVYEERDHSYYMDVSRSGDEKYIVLDEQSTLSSEVRFIRANRPRSRFRVLAPREHAMEYHADHIDHRWIVRTNWNAKNYRIMQVADARAGSKQRWRDIVPSKPGVTIDGFALFRNYLVVGERSDGLQRLQVRPWHGGSSYFVATDDADYTASIGDNREQNTDTLRYNYSSLITPSSVYDIDMKTGHRTLRKREEVLGGYDPANYIARRIWVTARDNARIPVSLLYRKDFKRDGTAPLYQYGYGSYGISIDPHFSSPRFSLVDRGFVYAIAHVRGGGEMGRAWYEDGKLLHKKNTFTDFIDVSNYLVKYGYAAKDKVFAEGGSAGGLLMGAIANMAPDTYRGIVAHVPFVDVVTTMLDDSIPLTTNEFDEWGNPQETVFYKYMLSYSPYDNVRAHVYPAMLITTGLWDSQVQYYEPTKWVAKLRAMKTGNNPLLLKINMDAGHGGKSGRYRRYREVAEEFSFILDQLKH
ncbi:MAG: S9 family peptidase [Rudaea sp.]